MDNKPFLVLDLTAIDETLIPEVAKLTKESFDLDSVVSAAGELKYIGQIKRFLAAQFKEPSGEFLRLCANHIYPGKPFTQRIREELSPLAAKATTQFLNEQVRERLNTALEDSSKTVKDEVKPVARLWFNRKQKYLGVFGNDKVETRLLIESPKAFISTPTNCALPLTAISPPIHLGR